MKKKKFDIVERERKVGEGSLKAWLRQGHKEIGQVLPAFPDSMKVVEEPGTFNNPTPHDVSKQTGAYQNKHDIEPDMEP